MVFCYSFFMKSRYTRVTHPNNICLLTCLVLSQAMFVGGLCAHSFISSVILAGLFVSTTSQAAAACYTWISGKSRRLKSHTRFFVLLGFGIYIGLFVLVWNLLDSRYSLTQRQFLILAWLCTYLPLSFYFPYALVLYVLPELDD